MRRVFIKYNPYQVTTEITVDDRPLKKNSRLNVPADKRLQEWVDGLPDILCEECGGREFKITFHGTALDFEDIEAVAAQAGKRGIRLELRHIPAKEVKDKEQAIAAIFADIQKGPFAELKQPDVVRAFKMANNDYFEVSVVATMSAGKSTLINAFLGQKLMPAKQEACTATITEIKDNDGDHFEADVFDKDGNLLEKQLRLTYDIMDRLNADKRVSRIHVEGDIPFLKAEGMALVLVDTPGPNNSRDMEHKAATYRLLSESSKALVLYIMNATQLAVDDDSNLLGRIAESMKVGGKQSRDRFIFVVNKLDDFKKGEDSVEAALRKVREYLGDKGIENPNIFPASALTALNIRTILAKSDDENDDDVYEAKGKVRKFNRNEEMHFEKYAPLPVAAKEAIAARLARAQEEDDKNTQALIHSGVVSVEEAIELYVLKYAKTAKIKNIADTFTKKLESAASFEQAKKEIASNQQQRDRIVERIDRLEGLVKSGREAQKFKEKIRMLNFDSEISQLTNSIIKKAQERITQQLRNVGGNLSRNEAENQCARFAKFADNLQAQVKVELEDLIDINVQRTATGLLQQYQNKLAELAGELSIGNVKVEPLSLMKGDVSLSSSAIMSIIREATKTERERHTREVWVENTSKRWWKPWTWFQDDGYYRTIVEYEDREYVDGTRVAQKFFAPIQESLYENSSSTKQYAKETTERVKKQFEKKFDELDILLGKKLNELRSCAADKAQAQRAVEEAQQKMAWLQKIQSRVNAILEI